MKSKLFSKLVLTFTIFQFLYAGNLCAQTITIGNGVSTTNYGPYRGLYEDGRTQYIITSAELTTAGLTPGSTLTSLSFNISSKASTQAYTGFTIKLAHTATSNFASASWLTPAFTTVYNGNYTTALGWNLHTFSTGFTWDGTSNIVVETCFDNTGYTSNDQVYYTSTASNTVCYAEVDGGAGCSLSAESTSLDRPNMKFDYTPGALCSGTPVAGTASASPDSMCAGETSTISLSGFTAESGITFQWQSSPDNTVWTNIGGATATSYSASPATSTYYRCVVTCTNSGLSENSASTLLTINICAIFGTGTSTVTYPYRGFYHDARSQYIITAAELSAAGITPGSTLNSLSFNVSLKESTQAYSGFNIKIGHTTASGFSSATWLTPAFSTVYNNNYTTAAGWNLHTFSTNFTWNGTDNIVIETCFDNTSYTSDDPVYCTTIAGNTVCYAEMDASTGCTLAGESTGTSRPNMKFDYTPGSPCSGAPAAGTASASPASVCAGETSTISLSGFTAAGGITFQWQSSPDNTIWNNIGGATSASYSASPITSTYYRCVVTCTNSGISENSASDLLTILTPVYANLPVTESFEGPWISSCDIRDVPANNWLNTPKTGNNSWRRHDDGIAAAGWSSNTGLYSPVSSDGSFSAEFNSYNASSGTTGSFDLYVDMSPAGIKTLFFDYINPGTPTANDKMDVLLSTDGGATFSTTLLNLTNTTSWTTQSADINSTSATCVIRFLATSDWGSSGENTGIDNVRVLLPCSGNPTAGIASALPASICTGDNSTISLSGFTAAGGITFQWQSSPDNTVWTDIGGATSASYSASPITSTYYRCVVTCTNSGLSENSTSDLLTILSPVYATLPVTESFEGPWISSCDIRDVPINNWLNTPKTGNNSWRRHDDGIAAAGWSSNSGLYSPVSSDGSFSAEFNSYNASSGTTGSFDLYVDMSPAGTKTLFFDYINPGTPTANDKMDVLLSTDGGATFSTTLLNLTNTTSWTTQSADINSTSATCVIRFLATSDYGSSGENTGIDNLSVVALPVGIENNISENKNKLFLDCYPNPFKDHTLISFMLPESDYVILKLYDFSGKEIIVLLNKQLNAGKYSFDMSSNNLQAGIYFLKLQTNLLDEQKIIEIIK